MKQILLISIIIVLTVVSCIAPRNTSKNVKIAPSRTEAFNNRLKQRYTDYSQQSTSYYNKRYPYLRGLCLTNLSICVFNKERYWERFVMYTFDRKDSCVLFTDSLQGDYCLPLGSIPVPEGYYFFGATDTTLMLRPANHSIPI
jgi:hypothetical protein